VELHGEEGAIERQASEFLAEALELGSRRAHEVVTPRVDLVAISEGADRDAFLALVRERRVGTILVHKGDVDQIHGYVRIKDLVRRSELTPKELVRPIWYVPRTKSLESLLREMIERREQLALVVGEYGGTDGLVTLEDVVEEITGDIAQQDAWPLVRGGGEEGVWIMAGRLPLREAGELLGLRFDPGPTTLGGFLAQELGRLPEEGDVVWRARVQFRVGSVERRRARDVVVSLPSAGRVVAARRSNEVSQAMTRSGAMRAERRLTDWVADAPEPEPNTDAEPKA
jgi:CBS domain containing-hemolysin-like protein